MREKHQQQQQKINKHKYLWKNTIKMAKQCGIVKWNYEE